MQTTPSRELHREIARLAIGAALISFLLPLLPLYGGSIFSVGLPLRGLISFFLGWWTNVAVVTVGILYLRRDRIGVAGGIFLAVALTLAFAITRQVLETAPHFGSWQTDLFLILEIIEGVLLALAAVRALGTRSA
jgi:cytosine/uracil/thiamine/allantoin permease